MPSLRKPLAATTILDYFCLESIKYPALAKSRSQLLQWTLAVFLVETVMPKENSLGRAAVEEPKQLRKLFLAAHARYWAQKRTETLLDLANLPNNCSERFWKRFRLQYRQSDSDSPLLDYRDRLRKIWSGDHSAAGDALNFWVRQATLYNRQSWLLSSGEFYWVTPNHHILPLSLAIGVSELLPKMAVCANPECSQPYFLKGRKNQRFCDRPTCAAYGQRQHKKKWWSEHGDEWRERHERAHKSLAKKRWRGGR